MTCCFSCLNPRTKDIRVDIDNARCNSRYQTDSSVHGSDTTGTESISGILVNGKVNSPIPGGGARSFTFKELAAATRNFREVNLLGEGGFGRVYKGRLDSGQVVAIKQLNPDGLQGNREFIVEVLMLSLLHHPNLVTLIGYCTSGDQRLLVYEYMPMGSLEDHLFDLESNQEPLSWNTRMKIAVGQKQGEQNLVTWSRPYLKDQKKFGHLVDPSLRGKYPRRCLNYAIAIIAMCLNEEAHYRPFIGDIVVALEYLAAQSRSHEARNVSSPSPEISRTPRRDL
ncbi:unnamed protein product [Arabidopsis thaliana]|uniref:(thale cress) hypothetical protein n=1 Tax=Arabidopsis thaliana TaxID=3702 RepID=A0A7G2DWU6_ARATH|nr:unnamed protein product [Arabidopsis thaliana]